MRTDIRPILIVDDTAEIRDLVADALADEGYAVACAANGAEALMVAARAKPALVLLDLNMPVLDGWGFARVARERGIHTPIVLLTAAGEAARHAQEIGAADFVGKPFDLVELLDTVTRVYAAATLPGRRAG